MEQITDKAVEVQNEEEPVEEQKKGRGRKRSDFVYFVPCFIDMLAWLSCRLCKCLVVMYCQSAAVRLYLPAQRSFLE